MAKLSAGVYITEIDNSAIVPTVSNSTAFFAGNFTKGPVEQPFVITNKAELETYFGKPTNTNYNEWFQCYKFFDYGNQLVVSRGFTENTPTALEATTTIVIGAQSFIVEDPIHLTIGTMVGFTSSSAEPQSWYEITQVKQQEISGFSIEVNSAIAEGADENTTIMVKGTHTNSSVLVYNNPTENASVSQRTAYNQGYELYKNRDDFDFKADAVSYEAAAAIAGVQPEYQNAKLKFIARTAGSVNDGIEIAIANPIDFTDAIIANTSTGQEAGREATRAQAFQGVSLTSLFQYAPLDDDIAIAIRQGDVTETYIVSFDETAVDGNNKSKYIETVINNQSRLVYVVDNVGQGKIIGDMKELGDTYVGLYIANDMLNLDLTDRSDTFTTYDSFVESQLYANRQATNTVTTTTDEATVPYIVGVNTTYNGFNPEITIVDLYDAYFEVEDKEYYEIDIVIGNEKDLGAGAISLSVNRQDCIAFVGARYEDVVGKKSAIATNAIVDYMLGKATDGAMPPESSMFAAFFGNYHKIYDNYAKKYRWINCAGDMAGLRANTNSSRASWWASAGLRRGVVRNIDRLSFSPSKPQRDSLYKNSINPVVAFPGEGNVVWGQKTLLNYASSFDRINVRGLFNTIERAMSKAARSEVFEFNDPYTRNAILAMFNPFLSSVKAGRGVADFLVICDTTNNTPDVISRNELVADIYIKPMYAAEFIQLNFNNVGTRSFASVIGS